MVAAIPEREGGGFGPEFSGPVLPGADEERVLMGRAMTEWAVTGRATMGLDDGLPWAAGGSAPELKSAGGATVPEPSAGGELRELLEEMTQEMRSQFLLFRDLRSAAQAMMREEGDEAAQKLIRADAKAAADAVSLIVRTLEKIDSLQRQLARDLDEEAERHAEAGGYEAAVREVHALIDQRAREFFEQWRQAGSVPADGTLPDVLAGGAFAGAGGAQDGTGPPDIAAARGEDGKDGGEGRRNSVPGP